jgi:hypothetical protein
VVFCYATFFVARETLWVSFIEQQKTSFIFYRYVQVCQMFFENISEKIENLEIINKYLTKYWN